MTLHWLLVDRFKVKNPLALLGMSSSSLRAVHILAIAFRALLRQSLNLKITVVEQAALGNVRHRVVKPADDFVTTKLEPPSKSKKSVIVQGNLDSKLTMKYENSVETVSELGVGFVNRDANQDLLGGVGNCWY